MMPLRSVGDAIHEFLRLESAGGILLMLAAATGLVLANTSAEGLYQSLLGTPVEIRVGALTLAKPLVLWINDGLMAVVFLLVGLAVLNLAGTRSVPAYFFVGLVLWVAVLKSGVHATLAGVALALFIPIRSSDPEGVSPLRRLEHDLHPVVAFGILPLFALANAG